MTAQSAQNALGDSPAAGVPLTHPVSTPTTARTGISARRSPSGSALRRSSRYSPYRAGREYTSPSEETPRTSSATRQVVFSSPTPPRPPRSPAPPRRAQTSPATIGRPRDDIWQHYYIERESGKKHGRCKYCGKLNKNGKPSGNLLNHLTKPKQCPNVPRDVVISLRPTPHQGVHPQPVLTPAYEPSQLTQDAFEMAIARIFFVCALPFMLVEAPIFREFLAMVAPTLKPPSRHKLSGLLLKRVRDQIRQEHVIKLINKHVHVSIVTDGWSDVNGSSIINFMVVAPGMPSVFWSSWSTRSAQHTAKYIAGEIEKVIDEIERETTARIVAVVTDNARNMKSASSRIHASRPNVVGGGCAAHVLNLLMQDVCQFPAIRAVQSRAVAITRFVKDHLALLDEFKRLQQEVRDTGFSARNLVLPVPTRWYSVFSCLRSVLNSQDVLEKLFLSPDYEHFRDRYRGTEASRKKLRYMTALVGDIGFWNSLRTIVRLLDPIITALRELEADGVFVSAVYKWFRWLRYHSAYGVTAPEREEDEDEAPGSVDISTECQSVPQGGMELLSNTAESITAPEVGSESTESESTLPDDERLLAGCSYERITAPPLDELQGFIREKIKKRWKYVHTNAMGIAFMLDHAMDLDDFVGSDDEKVEGQICKMAKDCGLIAPTTGTPKLTAEILSFKSKKRVGGENMRVTYSESSPRDYWSAKSNKNYPLLQKIAEMVFAIPTSSAASERAWSIFDHIHSKRRNRLSVDNLEMLAYIYINHGTINKDVIDLARHQSCPESVDIDN